MSSADEEEEVDSVNNVQDNLGAEENDVAASDHNTQPRHMKVVAACVRETYKSATTGILDLGTYLCSLRNKVSDGTYLLIELLFRS